MTIRTNKKRMLRFEFGQNEINELAMEQEQDENGQTRIEPPWVGTDDSGRLYTFDKSMDNSDLASNPTSQT